MYRKQNWPQHLAGHEEVADIGPAPSTGRTPTTLLQRTGIALELEVPQPHRSRSVKAMAFRPFRVGITQSNRSMPRAIASSRSSGRPTPISTAADRRANAGPWHLESDTSRRAVRRHSGRRPHSPGSRARPALGAAATEVGIESSLDDGKQGLIGTPGCGAATGGPAGRRSAGIPDDGCFVWQRHYVVQDHRHVAAEGLLNGHRPFR